MRYQDLCEGLVGSESDVQGMLQTIVMSLAASEMDEIPTSMIAQELKDKMMIEVPYGQLMMMLQNMPMVDTATEDSITIRNDDSMADSPEDDAKDQVAQMATNGVSARNDI